MKKFMFKNVMIIGLLLCGCSGVDQQQDASQPPEDVFVDAKINGYESIEELEADSDLTVIGKKIEEIDSGVNYCDGVFEFAYTYSSFRIEEVISNRINETEQEIIIFENQAYDETQNQILHIAGYEKMLEGNTYLLYLRDTEKNHYVPLSAVIGKVPLSRSEIQNGSSLFRNHDDGEEVIAALHKQIQDRYHSKIDENN